MYIYKVITVTEAIYKNTVQKHLDTRQQYHRLHQCQLHIGRGGKYCRGVEFKTIKNNLSFVRR